ncbi:unnamed protein product [Prorocentrum cordatum]|uniref:Uncharacterized protein n=1 Tax=Prorocentrum cordatum TaxID=2364126 RepID=A0ABN9U3L0_9DINO|nr:unnamed protein product [Polarella glacialis]
MVRTLRAKLSELRECEETCQPLHWRLQGAQRARAIMHSSAAKAGWASTLAVLFWIASDAGYLDVWEVMGVFLAEVIAARLLGKTDLPMLSSLVHPIASYNGGGYTMRDAFMGSWVHSVNKDDTDPIQRAGRSLLARCPLGPTVAVGLLVMAFLRTPDLAEFIAEHLPLGATPGQLVDVLGAYKSNLNAKGARFVRGRRLPRGRKIKPNLDLNSLTLADVAGAAPVFQGVTAEWKATAAGLVAALETCVFKRGVRLMTPHVLGHFVGWGLLLGSGLEGFLKGGPNTAKFRQGAAADYDSAARKHWDTLAEKGALTGEERERLAAVPAEAWPGMECKAVCVAQNFAHADEVSNWKAEGAPRMPEPPATNRKRKRTGTEDLKGKPAPCGRASPAPAPSLAAAAGGA